MAEVDQINADPPPPSTGQVDAPADIEPDAASVAGTSTAEETPNRHVTRWDRPPPPKDWRWWVGRLGYTLIVTGLLLLGFVAYQLWGTGIETARAQRALHNDFEELLADAPPVVVDEPVVVPVEPVPVDDAEPADQSAVDQPDEEPPTGTLADDAAGGDDAGTPVPVESQNIPHVENGDALAQLEIPAIGVDDIVVAGVQTGDLKKGPGHFPETPLPGQLGNSAIAGHRTTYGQPFHNVDKLVPGDEIVVTTLSGRYVYVVTGQQIVSPSDYHVVTTVDPTIATLTLTSCHPKWTASERIVVSSVLNRDQSSVVGEPVVYYGRAEARGDVAEAAIDDGPGASTPVTEPTPAATIAGDAGDAEDDAGADAGQADEVASSGLADPATIDDELVGVGALATGGTDEGIADAFAEGWFSDSGAFAQVVLWAVVLVAIWLAGYLISRRFRRFSIGIAVVAVPFVVALYFFYQNVNRLLPPNL